MRILAFAALALLLGTRSYGEPGLCSSSTGASIRVHGSANVHQRPDRVTFTVGVQTQGSSVTGAFKANSARVNTVLSALEGRGVKADEIQTSSFDITTVPASKLRPRGFMVESFITVTRADTTSVGELLQAAVDAGANQAGSLRFFIADTAAVHRRGLELAFQDARSRADALAASSNRPLGKALCMSDDPIGSVYDDESDKYTLLRSLGYAGSPAPRIVAGSQDMTVGVSVVFELK